MSRVGYAFLKASTLDIMPSIKDWPPKPGSTVITSTISTKPWSTHSVTTSTLVPGFNPTPTFMPASFTCLHSTPGSLDASEKDFVQIIFWAYYHVIEPPI